MTVRILASLALLFFAANLGAVEPAAPVNEEKGLVDKVNKSIDHAVQFLRSRGVKEKDGTVSWERESLLFSEVWPGGISSLATMALLNSGVKPTEKDLVGALEYLRKLERKRTYVVGLTTMVFTEARDPRDLGRIQENVDWLLKVAIRDSKGNITGWGYGANEQMMDGSNTQYALLGLYAGKQAGAKVKEEEWKRLREFYIQTQARSPGDTGFWSYRDREPIPSFTMTVAGVCGVVIAGMGLDSDTQQLDPKTGKAAKCGIYESDDAVRRGMNFISRNFSFYHAPGQQSAYYNIYGLERVGRLTGQRFIGNVDWYRDGCQQLVKLQRPDGSWSQDESVIDKIPTVATSFALLFLSKGRTPILISKLAHGDFHMDQGVLVETGKGELIEWNRKHDDARHLTEMASKQLFNGLPLGWQVYDPRRRDFPKKEDILAEVGVLVQSPILYFNGHKSPNLKPQHKEILKKYVEEGGFILAESCCGSPEFTDGFRELMKELFPDSKLASMPAEHSIWKTFYLVPPTEFPKLECLDRGCRTVVVFSPEPLAGYWEESKYLPEKSKKDVNRGELAYRLAGNIIAYATGMEPPQQRLTQRRIVEISDKDKSPPKGFIKPAQLKFPGENHPAPAAMRNLMGQLQTAAKLDVVLDRESISPGDDEIFKYRFVYAHGRKKFELTDKEIENLRVHLQSGGLLFADSCCGKPEFDESFRALAAKLFPEQKLKLIDLNDELYSAKLNGAAITTVKRREQVTTAEGEGGFKDLPPFLEGVKIDGRWVIIYSKFDIGCALEGHKSTDCLGHTRDSALKLASAAILYALKR